MGVRSGDALMHKGCRCRFSVTCHDLILTPVIVLEKLQFDTVILSTSAVVLLPPRLPTLHNKIRKLLSSMSVTAREEVHQYLFSTGRMVV
jgi:hypothetical protein